jgi:hypothetical protein
VLEYRAKRLAVTRVGGSYLGQQVGGAVTTSKQFVGLRVVDDLFLFRVPPDLPSGTIVFMKPED